MSALRCQSRGAECSTGTGDPLFNNRGGQTHGQGEVLRIHTSAAAARGGTMRATTSSKLVLERLVEYLGADVDIHGGTVTINDFGDGKGVPEELGAVTTSGHSCYWDAVMHLLTSATPLEECGGQGCTYLGIREAIGYEFKVDRDGTLMLPVEMSGSASAAMGRVYQAEQFDAMGDALYERLTAGAGHAQS